MSLDYKQLALRGSNLANTDWAIGTVIYTGKQTKLMLNQGLYRFKQSKVEKLVNIIVVYLVIIQFILCTILSIFAGRFTEANVPDTNSVTSQSKAEYIFFTGSFN